MQLVWIGLIGIGVAAVTGAVGLLLMKAMAKISEVQPSLISRSEQRGRPSRLM